jgi:hypothetical protein
MAESAYGREQRRLQSIRVGLRIHLERQLAAVLLACGVAACGSEQPVSEEDKSIFLRAEDFARLGYRYENLEAHETFSKARHFDGSHKLTYRFDSPEGEAERPLHIYITVSIERREADAMLAQKAQRAGLLVGFKSEGAEERELSGTLPYGAETRLALLVKDDSPIGNTFTFRDKEKTYLLVVSGLYFDDPELFTAMIAPKVRRFGAYSP